MIKQLPHFGIVLSDLLLPPFLSLKVRVFGIPVYERGVRVRSLNDMPNEIPNSIPSTNANEPKVVGGSDDELPIYNFRENPYKMVPLWGEKLHLTGPLIKESMHLSIGDFFEEIEIWLALLIHHETFIQLK